VTLTDVTGELESSRNLSLGAMRFTLVGPAEYAVPVVNGFSPVLTPAGGGDFTLTLSGSGFYPESVVRWNGSDRPTTFVSKTELTALISAADIATAGMMNVTVQSPPGGGESTAVIFPVINISPAKREVLTASKVTFDWDDITGATQYKIQVSKYRDFSTILFRAKTSESVYFYEPYLKYSTRFFWRLKYEIDGVWSAWSPAWKFTSMDPLSPPLLIDPDHRLRVYSSSVTLNWEPVPNATLYQVQIAKDSSFIIQIKQERLTSTSATYTLKDGRYYWRVRALDPYKAKSPWSEVRIVKVDAVP